MKFGVTLGAANPKAWVDITVAADQLGYESVWMPEHLVIPVAATGSPIHGDDHPPIPANVPVYDTFTYLAYLAARTERIRFGTHVYNVGLRHPFVTARAVTTLDVLSGGRVELGIGASWLRQEWDAVGLDFDTRGRRVDEALDVLRMLWTDEVIEHHGEFFDFDAVMFEPKPAQQGGPRLHIGGDGAAAKRRAASVGDGWIPMNHTLEQLTPAVEQINEQRDRHGITSRVEVTFGGTVANADDVARYADAGVDRLIVRPWASSREAIAGLEHFAKNVIASAAELGR